MADMELENLRTVLNGLADRLNKTEGDIKTIDQLSAVEKAIKHLEAEITKAANRTPSENRKLAEDITSSLINELDRSSLAKDIGKAVSEGVADALPQDKIKMDPNQAGSLLGNFAGVAKKTFGALSLFSSVVDKTAVGLSNASENLNGSFEGAAKAFGVNSASALLMAKSLDTQVNAYRSLTNSAEGTIGSLTQMQNVATRASINVSELADVMSKGGRSLRLIGAAPWAELYNGIKEQTKAMDYYGYSSEQLQQVVGEYTELVASRGDLFVKPVTSEDINKLLLVNQDIAGILGTTRDEQLKAAQQAALNANMAMAINQRRNKDEIIQTKGMFDSISPELGKLFEEATYTRGSNFLTQSSQEVAAKLPPEVTNTLLAIAKGQSDGTVNAKQAIELTQDMAKAIREQSGQTKEDFGRLGYQLGGAFQSVNEITVGLQNVATKEDLEKQGKTNKGTEQKDDATKAALQVGQEFRDLGTNLRAAYYETMQPIMKNFGDTMLSSVQGFDSMNKQIADTISSLGQFETAMGIVGGALISGVLISTASGLVTGIIASKMIPAIGEIGKMLIGGPIKLLAGSIGSLIKFFETKFAKDIVEGGGIDTGGDKNDKKNKGKFSKGKLAAGAVATVGTLVAGAGSVENASDAAVLGAKGVAAATGGVVGAFAAEAADIAGQKAGETVAEKLVNNFPTAAAWVARNIFGHEIDQKAVDKANELSKQGADIKDYIDGKLDEPAKEVKPVEPEVKEIKQEIKPTEVKPENKSEETLPKPSSEIKPNDIKDEAKILNDIKSGILSGNAIKESTNNDFSKLIENPESYISGAVSNAAVNTIQELTDQLNLPSSANNLNMDSDYSNIKNTTDIDPSDKIVAMLQKEYDLNREGLQLTIDKLNKLNISLTDLIRILRLPA